MTLLTVSRLCKAFGGVIAAHDVTFTVASGELVALIGPNGAGKSTTFNMVGGQLAPDSGTVTLDGFDITGLASHAIWRRGASRTFQIAQAFVSMTAAENIQIALQSHTRQTFNLWKTAHVLHRDEAIGILQSVGLAGSADRQVGTLAYGDVKRVELAIALAGSPKLLLMDEPTAGMARNERTELMRLVGNLAREREVGVLFTEHDMDAVFDHATRILVLVRGELIAQGTPAEIRSNLLVQQIYLGTGNIPKTAMAASARDAG